MSSTRQKNSELQRLTLKNGFSNTNTLEIEIEHIFTLDLHKHKCSVIRLDMWLDMW